MGPGSPSLRSVGRDDAVAVFRPMRTPLPHAGDEGVALVWPGFLFPLMG